MVMHVDIPLRKHYKFLPRFLIEILIVNYTTVIARNCSDAERCNNPQQRRKAYVGTLKFRRSEFQHVDGITNCFF